MIIEVKGIIDRIKHYGFKYLGSGSGRIVYDLQNGYVVKVAGNSRGIAQNIMENKISSEEYSDIFAKVYYVSDDYRYLIMKKAEPLKIYSPILRYFNIRTMKELMNVKKLQYIHKRYKLMWGDLVRISSWGIIDGQPVIIDYGLTNTVAFKYYR